ncbi:MAG TPA: gamma-glutamyltransferase [Terriglobales bacterium]|nr:gamma-glutamyltransferase [Terriglobales bacterium]
MPSIQNSHLARTEFDLIEGRHIVCSRGVVATGPAAAARIGAEILARGGNAMDAAAAAALACSVLEPESVDLGGYIFCAVVRKAGESRTWVVDANAVAPKRASERMFEVRAVVSGNSGINESEYGCSVRNDENIYGPLSIAVPGFMAGVGTLWERWGRLRWPEIVAPCQQLVAEGFAYGTTAAAIARRLPVLQRFEASCRHLMPEGRVPQRNDVWHRPGLEFTLARLSAEGWRDFYSGELGSRIGRFISELGGILSVGDMAGYTPRIEPALQSEYRGHTVSASNVCAGGLTTLQILNFLDCFAPSIALDSPAYWHRLAEVTKLAWQDRLNYLADPVFAQIPADRLLSKDYAMGRTETLRRFPESLGPPAPLAGPAAPGTVHVSSADCEGNIVAATISQGAAFGSCVTIPETGIILGHGMSRLDPRPGRPNSIAPGKQPLSNVSPLILSLPDRKIALGTRGGRPIINVCAQLAHRIIDGGLLPFEALPAPRLSTCDREPLEFLKFDFTESAAQSILDRLTAMGHQVVRKQEVVEGAGAAHCAEILGKTRTVRAAGDTWAAGMN